MSFQIVCDSGCDFTATERLNPVYTSVPLTIFVEDREFIDDESLSVAALLAAIEQSPEPPKTACPSIDQFLQAFDCGADEVYAVTLSGELSGSYNAAFQARRIFLEEHPDKKVHVFNSRSAASGELAVARFIYALARVGTGYGQIVAQTEEYIASMRTLFVLDNLEVLRKNGRLTGLQKIVTSALKIKLVMGATPAGTICKLGQALSGKQALGKLAAMIEERCREIDMSGRLCVISHCACLDRARYVSELIRDKCNFREIVITSTIGLSSVYANAGGIIVAF